MTPSIDPSFAGPDAITPGREHGSDTPLQVTRRNVLTWAAAPGLGFVIAGNTQIGVFRVSAPVDAQIPDLPQLIVAGPDDGPLTPWADIIHAVIDRLSANGQKLQSRNVGGVDGVTAANQFEARTAPDGSTAMLTSGEPAIAWLVGDQRAQFDAGHWLPIVTGLTSGIVLSRSTLASHGGQFRLAIRNPKDLAIAARLGLSLLGVEITSVIATSDPSASLQSGQADFAFIRGTDAVDSARDADLHGMKPIFTLGMIGEAGNLTRDPLISQVPHFPELAAKLPSSPNMTSLLAAWRATAAAAQLEFALVLPWLSPAGTVAWWRKAATQIAVQIKSSSSTSAKSGRSADQSLEVCADPTSSFGLSAIAVDAVTSLALRKWLISRSI